MPFDGLLTLAERLRNIGQRLPDSAGRPNRFSREHDEAAVADRAFLAEGGGPRPLSFSQTFLATDQTNAHAWQQRQTEILLRVDENLRRLRELVESRAAAATALFADPL